MQINNAESLIKKENLASAINATQVISFIFFLERGKCF